MANEDRLYLEWIRRRPCCAPGGCRRPAEAHHPRHDVAMSRRAHDHRAVPLCHEHHLAQLHGGRGVFADWTRERLRQFFDEVARRLRAWYLAGLSIPF